MKKTIYDILCSRQFRMTRLDEDDDDLMMSNDTDDFVGGQEASFSNSSYTRFK